MSFWLVPKSVTWMTLNGVMALFCVISANSCSFPAHCVKVHVHYLISWWVLVITSGPHYSHVAKKSPFQGYVLRENSLTLHRTTGMLCCIAYYTALRFVAPRCFVVRLSRLWTSLRCGILRCVAVLLCASLPIAGNWATSFHTVSYPVHH